MAPVFRRLSFYLLLCVCSLIFHSYAAEPRKHDFTVMVPMRDGVKLPADVYLPPGETGKSPTIVIRSPSGRKNPFATNFVYLADAGYVVAIQDTRSVLDEEGKTIPYLSDGWGAAQDGYDTVEWIAAQDFSDGRIGTIGVSAMGVTQIMMAPTAPPSLKCQYIGVAPASIYHYAICPGGQVLKHQVESWLGYYAKDPGVHNTLCVQPFYNEFWENFDTLKAPERIKVPAVHQGGWYDTFLQGTIDAFVSRQEHGGEGAKGTQKLVIGPWIHFWPVTTALGDFEVPKEGYAPPADLSPKRWFDFYVKGEDNGVGAIPAVMYYVMGPFDGSPSSGNVWKTAAKWPVDAVETPYYLSDGALVAEREATVEKQFSYVYDPFDPTETIGGRNLFLDSGPKDQRPVEKRHDVVVFTTAPLQEDVEVTGRIKVFLNMASDNDDTDIVVRLCDVYPDGRSILVTDGITRTAMARIQKAEAAPQHGVPMEYEIDLWSTSIVFAKGHSIRISVTGSNYPRYEKNMNVGFLGSYSGEGRVVHNELYVGGKHLSRVVLPLVTKRVP